MTQSAISIWCIPLQVTARAERRLLALLDTDEAARAARLLTRDLRRRYVVAHGALRVILSRFTGREPAAIRFVTGARGKPSVAGGPHFSLSRGDDVALVAVTTGGPVGVDVERIRPDLRIDAIARDVLPAPEVVRIEALPPQTRGRAWFQAWTRLEAVAKASGEGLGGRERGPFHTWDLDVDATHVGAVATAAQAANVVYEALLHIPPA